MTASNRLKPRGIRNKNPANIRNNPNFTWDGQIGVDGAGFVIFDSFEHGVRAFTKVLVTYKNQYAIDTISSILYRYAPPIENDTESYINSVSARTGLDKNKKLNGQSDYLKVMDAMIYHENGQPFPFSLIESGYNLGMNS